MMASDFETGAMIFRFVLMVIFLVPAVSCQTPPSKKDLDMNKAFPEEISCIGPAKSKNFAVYLHGFTDHRFSGTELKNYKELQRLSHAMNMMFAIPKSPKGCMRHGKIKRCWGTEMTESQASEALTLATRAAQKCFPRGSEYGVVGFSNGGYIATKIFGYCLAPRQDPNLSWIVTVGAAKLWGAGVTKGNLRQCRPITLVAGKRDTYNYERRQRKFRDLRRKGAEISILLFDGGHEMPFGPMVTAMRGYLKGSQK